MGKDFGRVGNGRGSKRTEEDKEGLERTGVCLLAVVTTPSPCGRVGEGSVSCCDYVPSLAGRVRVGLPTYSSVHRRWWLWP